MTLVDGDAAEQLMSPLQQGEARRSLRTAADGATICMLSVPDIRYWLLIQDDPPGLDENCGLHSTC